MSPSPSSLYQRRFLAPRYWPTWAGLGLLWLLAKLPFGWQMGLGKAVGNLFYYLVPIRRRTARINLQLCFPELAANDRQRLLKQHYQSLGINLFEMSMAWWRDPKWLSARYRVEGLEHVNAGLERKKGVLLLLAHFTTMELVGTFLGIRLPLHVTYSEPNNPLFRAFLKSRRDRLAAGTITHRDVRQMVRVLKQNELLWYSPDQSTQLKRGGIIADYFGMPVVTTTGTTKLARITGCAVIPFLPRRLPDNSGYELRFFPALTDFPGANIEEDTRRINALLEVHVRQIPDQYLWVHRRFRKGPQGSQDPYNPKTGS